MKSFSPLLALLLLTACNHHSDRVTIEGEIKNIRQAELYLYADNGNAERIDTIFVKNGQFSITRPLTSASTFTLLFPNFFELPIVAYPGDEINVKADATHLAQTIIKGNDENEALTTFRHATNEKSEREQSLAAQQFIYDNVTTQAAIAVFKRHFVRSRKPVPSEALPLLDTLAAAQPQNEQLAALQRNFTARMLSTEGQPLPRFEEVTLSGDTIKSDDYTQAPTVIALWASWHRDSRALLRKLHKLETTFEHQGVKFLHVSFDPSTATTKRSLHRDTLHGPVICDQQCLSSPLVSTFGVRSIPEFILVNKNGIIVRRDLEIDQLEEEIKKILQ
ncbi:MAG: AhpC/TSA family protein [Bacteroidaceae bacterium]|nr:AhpC/TSA family protein [Bacteroidaceae bacterium]